MPEVSKKVLEGVGRLATLADVEEVVADLAKLLRKNVNVQWLSVFFFRRDDSGVSPGKTYGSASSYREVLAVNPLSPDKVRPFVALLRKRRGIVVSEAVQEFVPEYVRLTSRLHLVVIPMIIHNDVTGMVVAARRNTLPQFTADEMNLMRDLVSHAALVVSHIRLFDESLDLALDLAQRIDVILTLDEINRAISASLSRKRVLETTMAHLERILTASVIAVLKEEEGELQVLASCSSIPEVERLLRPGPVPGTTGCAARNSLARHEPVTEQLDGRQPSDFEKRLHHAGIHSLLAVPLSAGEKVRGVLLTGDTAADRYGAHEIFTTEKIAGQLGVALENARLYEDLHALFISTVASLANAIDAKSPWTKGHSERVMRICGVIARQMDLPDEVVERVKTGGLLHDVGKIGILESLLEKKESLTDEESPTMRLHPEKGVAILSPIVQLQEVLPGILHHHERYDGTGYPAGLKGEDIPLEARIITVADSFDAMVAIRPYKKGRTVREALEELEACAGTQFDPKVVDCFKKYITRKMPDQLAGTSSVQAFSGEAGEAAGGAVS